ncbi:MAG: hypothetical protein WBR23_01920 [Candidatus Dormiibacterota bacterium]
MTAVEPDQAKARRRTLAKQAFNHTWDLIGSGERTPDDDREMLFSAAASRFLCEEVGGEQERGIGDWQIAHLLSLLGDGEQALGFASEALRRVESNGWEDWRKASCLQGMARASAVLGPADERDRYAALCRELIARFKEPEEREIVGSQLDSIEGVERTDPATPSS